MKIKFRFLICGLIIVFASYKDLATYSPVLEIVNQFSKIKDNLYISKYETSNKNYRDFLDYLQRNNQKEAFEKNLLDTAKWKGNNERNEPYIYYYHSHKSFNNYPVVTVTYKSAVNYCNWLTQQYNADPKRKFKKAIFRLPTEAEWEFAANSGKESRIFPWDGILLQNKKGMKLANYRGIYEANISYNHETNSYKIIRDSILNHAITSECSSFFPNDFGLYNMAGNVAEMVAEKGIAKGGSYDDPGFDIRIKSVKKYDSPSPEIGFRVLMEVIEQ